ncbi:MAG: hypothetical protein J7M25_08010 [Deltaproteobacteria bacterium]|nr:hypothetical protein [Deltaproteobacteria bacterium]
MQKPEALRTGPAWKRFGPALSFVIVMVGPWASGCHRNKAKKAKRQKPLVGQPNDKGDYTFRVKLPPKLICNSDADCTFTHLRPGHCCPNQCDVQPGNRAWVHAVRHMHYPVCLPFYHKHGGLSVCGTPRCPPDKGIPRGRCVNHRCTVLYKSVVPKVNVVPTPTLPLPRTGKGVRAGKMGNTGKRGKAGRAGKVGQQGKPGGPQDRAKAAEAQAVPDVK